ncbi:MAG: c-type cytochrome [Deltaproteobacteria bacterium]|nr:c-type cytochrome [Deltaproteobacteria bacterium]
MRVTLKNYYIAAAVIFMATVFSAHASGESNGQALFRSNDCAGCHITVKPDESYTTEDALKEEGPPLWFAGSKYKPGFIRSFLENPEPIRPLEYNSIEKERTEEHPNLSPSEAEAVAAYLSTLTVKLKPIGIKAKASARGRIIFEKKESCYGCHRVEKNGRYYGGRSGPILIGASTRLNPEWVYYFLKDPYLFGDPLMMPSYKGILNDEEIRELASYIATFK